MLGVLRLASSVSWAGEGVAAVWVDEQFAADVVVVAAADHAVVVDVAASAVKAGPVARYERWAVLRDLLQRAATVLRARDDGGTGSAAVVAARTAHCPAQADRIATRAASSPTSLICLTAHIRLRRCNHPGLRPRADLLLQPRSPGPAVQDGSGLCTKGVTIARAGRSPTERWRLPRSPTRPRGVPTLTPCDWS